jgi:ankyrin repeat protein
LLNGEVVVPDIREFEDLSEAEFKDYARRIVSEGADVNSRYGSKGISLLYFAVCRHYVDATTFLLDELHADSTIADLDRRWTPLHFLARHPHFELAKLVLSDKTVNLKDADGDTPLQSTIDALKSNTEEYASEYKRMAALLISSGADVSAIDADDLALLVENGQPKEVIVDGDEIEEEVKTRACCF